MILLDARRRLWTGCLRLPSAPHPTARTTQGCRASWKTDQAGSRQVPEEVAGRKRPLAWFLSEECPNG